MNSEDKQTHATVSAQSPPKNACDAFRNEFEDFLHKRGIPNHHANQPEYGASSWQATISLRAATSTDNVLLHVSNETDPQRIQTSGQAEELKSMDDVWREVETQLATKHKPPFNVHWLRFKVTAGVLPVLQCSANEAPGWVTEQLGFDQYVRKKMPESDTPESKVMLLTERTSGHAKRLRQDEERYLRVSQAEREQYFQQWQTKEHVAPQRFQKFHNECLHFEAKFANLFQGSGIVTQAERVEHPKQGWCSNTPLLVSDYRRLDFLNDYQPSDASCNVTSDPNAFSTPLDIIQRILAPIIAGGKYDRLRRIQYYASPGDCPLLYYNVGEECDAQNWESLAEKEHDIAFIQEERQKKRVCMTSCAQEVTKSGDTIPDQEAPQRPTTPDVAQDVA